MNEKEKIIAEVTEKATKEAQAKKLNAAQTKLYVDEQVNAVITEFEKAEKAEKKAEENKDKTTKAEKKAEENKDKTTKAEKKAEKTEEKYIVKTPVRNFNGEVAGVQFAYGRAEVKPGWILNWFIEHGYTVEIVNE